MDVGDFLQLQCAFQSDWIMNAPAKEKKIMDLLIYLGQIVTGLVMRKDALKLCGNI